MPAAGPKYTIPYRPLGGQAGGTIAPWLIMVVTGVNGSSGPVWGLLDSGASVTTFPGSFAPLMGYTPDLLDDQTINGASGEDTVKRATVECNMLVAGLPGAPLIQIRPHFAPKLQVVLWGRTDFMLAYDVTFLEADQQFTIQQH